MYNLIMENEFKKKCFLFGAGFDRMFNLPLWTELTDTFAAFVKTNCKKDIRLAGEKVDIILKQNQTAMRKFQMLAEIAVEHDIKQEEIRINFFQKNLSVDNYKHDKKLFKVMKNAIDKTDGIIMTTNFSNILERMELKECYKISEYSTRRSYFPLHGNAFSSDTEDDLSTIVVYESDYLSPTYSKRTTLLEQTLRENYVTDLHIYGYSINDFEILKLLANLQIQNIIFYIPNDDLAWFNIQKNHLTKTFQASKVKFVSGDVKNSDGIYLQLFNHLLEAIPKATEEYSVSEIFNAKKVGVDIEGNNEQACNRIKSIDKNQLVPLVKAMYDEAKKTNELENLVETIVQENTSKYNANLFFALSIIATIDEKILLNKGIGNNLLNWITEDKDAIVEVWPLVKIFQTKETIIEYVKKHQSLWVVTHAAENMELFYELIKLPEFVFNVLRMVSNGYHGHMYIKDYQRGLEMTELRRDIFLILLKTIKGNIHTKRYTSMINLNTTGEEHLSESFLSDLVRLISLIKLQKEGKIHDIKWDTSGIYEAFNYLSWFSDIAEEKIIENKLKISKVIQNRLFIVITKDNSGSFLEGPKVSAVDKKFVFEMNGYDKMTKKELLKALLGGDVEYHDQKFVVESLISDKEIKDELILGIKKHNSKGTNAAIGNIIRIMIENSNKTTMLQILRENKFSTLSTDLIRILDSGNLLNIDDLDRLVFALNSMNLEEKEKGYPYGVTINSVEGKLIDLIIKLTIESNKYTNLTKETLVKLKPKNQLIYYVKALEYYLIEDYSLPEFHNTAERITFMETLIYKANLSSKFISIQFINFVTKMLSDDYKESKDLPVSIILSILINSSFEDVKELINSLDNFETWSISMALFQRDYKLKESQIWPNIKETLFFKKSLIIVSEREVTLSRLEIIDNKIIDNDNKEQPAYMIDLMIECIKESSSHIEPYDFQDYIKFGIMNNFSSMELVKISLRIKKPEPQEMSRSIEGYGKEDVIPLMLSLISDKEKETIKRHLLDVDIQIPKYFY